MTINKISNKMGMAILVFAGLSQVSLTQASTNPSCQIQVTATWPPNTGPSSFTLQGSFQMDPKTNLFYDLSFEKNGRGSAGSYVGDVATLSFPDALATVLFNPKTNSIISVQQQGVNLNISDAASGIHCNSTLTEPTCGEDVTNLYQSILNRAPDPEGLAYWTQFCKSGTLTRDQIQVDFFKSPEFVSQDTTGADVRYVCDANVDFFYKEFLYRYGESAGLTYWFDRCTENLASIGQIAQSFIDSPEYQQIHSPAGNPIVGVVIAPASNPGSASNTPVLKTSPQDPTTHIYIGSNSPSSYIPVDSPLGRQKLNNMIQATNSKTPLDVGSPDLMPHEVVEK